jgi:hypothetical protein
MRVIEDLRDAMLAGARDDHGREMVLRGFEYAKNRILDGSAPTPEAAKLAFAGFSDGFCTGLHRGNGTSCTR